MKTQPAQGDHPVGEDDLVFASYAGSVRLRVSEETLTPYGGLGAVGVTHEAQRHR
jgi:hypothetical protein